jgi:NAD(P) transhydrogenase subunit alpha
MSARGNAAEARLATESQPRSSHVGRRGSVSFTRPNAIRVIDRQRQVVPMKVGVARETAAGERRVALVPEALGKLPAAGLQVLVEAGAGAGAVIPDQAYTDAGATIVSTVELYGQSDAILRVQKPTASEISVMKAGQALLGLLQPLIDPETAAALAEQGVTAISLDAIPRTLSRAQSMDALSSQANVGGYKAVLVAANEYGRYFPLLTTAAGTAKPANVLILGIGVAGLQAIGTARRLGAVVSAYDVRPETAEQAESLGARFIKLKTTIDATGSGGYARELTAEERAAQQAELNEVIGGMDIVITTAQVPGRKPPVLVTADAVARMKPGSVIVDMAASALGGNCELSVVGQTITTENGVRIASPDNLPATMPAGASAFYARNISALLLGMVKDGSLNLDFEDEVTKATVITKDGAVVSDAVKKLLEPTPSAPAARSEPEAPAPTAPPTTPAGGQG